MANQGLDRRTALEMLAKAAAASQFPGFYRWAFGAEHQHAESPPAERASVPYRPMYFNESEYHAIEILTDLIIPEDETPGAKEAGVSEFIDFMAAHGEQEIRQPMRLGLAGLDASARKIHGAVFARLSQQQQIALLEAVADRRHESGPDADGHTFFLLIRRYTTMGYYTSRVGMKELEYPGLRLYTESPACPHTDDPEHRHLSPVKS